MALAAFAVRRRVFTYFAVLLFTFAGLFSFFTLGQLEDPEFTIKTAVITTPYPLASPEEVEEQVTDRIELALQQLEEIDHLESFSMPGLSQVKVYIRPEHRSDELPQIWDKLRARIRDVEDRLPPGAGRPAVNDTFGDVFGHLIALTGDGFTPAQMERYAKRVRRELSLVEGVARVELWGVRARRIFIDTLPSRLEQLGISETTIAQAMRAQNAVVDAGWVDFVDRRVPILPSGVFRAPTDIARLPLRPSAADLLGRLERAPEAEAPVLTVGDVGEVREGYLEPPLTLMRYNGMPAIAIAVSNRSGVNVVEMGRRLEERLQAIERDLPIGIELHRFHWQSRIIDEAVSSFLINFVEALAIVIAVLTLAMGWRMGLIIASALVATVAVTFLVMAIAGIDLQRMSLGALIIALGMMVDNAIVVADGYVTRRQRGMSAEKAAVEAADQPALPLLGATVIAVMAFYPIFASEESAGEYTQTLFSVVAIALLASWAVSITLTPIQCLQLLRVQATAAQPGGSEGRLLRAFRGLVMQALRFRLPTIALALGLLVASAIGAGSVEQLFFPDSSMPKFMIDIWSPQGTRIEDTSAKARRIEERLLADERVEAVASFIGAGPPRFYLPVTPESPNPAYAQVIVNVRDFRDIDDIARELDAWFPQALPDAVVSVRKYTSGPGNTWRFEMRITGPARASGDALRAEAEKVLRILRASPIVGAAETNWRQRTLRIVPEFDAVRARWSGATREDLAAAVKRAFDGSVIGLYRENDDLIPIVLRYAGGSRDRVGALDLLPVAPRAGSRKVPMAQLIDGIETDLIDPIIYRYNRYRTITVRANPALGQTLAALQADIADELAALELAPGFRWEWGGETESSAKAQKSLIPGAIPAVAIMLLVLFALFNDTRSVLALILIVPFALIGVIGGLLATGVPFGFVALLGAMSLSGMMLKNGIVLVDEITLNRARGLSPFEAVVEAAVSRLRPVMLAAATTVLGVLPLLQDVFWIGLAVVLMAGLTVGTVLTMVLLPVLYAALKGIRPQPAGTPAGEPRTAGA